MTGVITRPRALTELRGAGAGVLANHGVHVLEPR